jgi:creatinine amidohydrolase/Fe(II)-dependent formamide hydrolase-like protein
MPDLLRFAASVLLALSATAFAQTPSSLFLEDLTSPELAAAIRSGKTTILIPIGGTEQNGPHMALGKHNLRVRVLSERIARELGNALVAPVIAYVPEGRIDPPTGHMRYPGTITVPPDVYRKVLESVARSLRLAGFRDIVFLGDSGDYQADNAAVAAALNRAWKGSSAARAHAIAEYYRAATAGYFDVLKSRGYADAELGPHAGLADTSLMLAVEPNMVRLDKLQPAAGQGELAGVAGDPRRASAELGQLAVDAIVAQSVAAIRAAAASHRSAR